MSRILQEIKCRASEFLVKDLTRRIIPCITEVHFNLGPGLLESAYEEALAHEFDLEGIRYERQKEIELCYKGKYIGFNRIDFLVEDEIVLDIKSSDATNNICTARVLTYLKAAGKKTGLIINFNVEMLKEGIRKIAL